jgi:hypothetical protein
MSYLKREKNKIYYSTFLKKLFQKRKRKEIIERKNFYLI